MAEPIIGAPPPQTTPFNPPSVATQAIKDLAQKTAMSEQAAQATVSRYQANPNATEFSTLSQSDRQALSDAAKAQTIIPPITTPSEPSGATVVPSNVQELMKSPAVQEFAQKQAISIQAAAETVSRYQQNPNASEFAPLLPEARADLQQAAKDISTPVMVTPVISKPEVVTPKPEIIVPKDALKDFAETRNLSVEAAKATIDRYKANPTNPEFKTLNANDIMALNKLAGIDVKTGLVEIGVQTGGGSFITKSELEKVKKDMPIQADLLVSHGIEAYSQAIKDIGARRAAEIGLTKEQIAKETIRLGDNQLVDIKSWNKVFEGMPEEQAAKYQKIAFASGGGLEAMKAAMDKDYQAARADFEQKTLPNLPQNLKDLYTSKPDEFNTAYNKYVQTQNELVVKQNEALSKIPQKDITRLQYEYPEGGAPFEIIEQYTKEKVRVYDPLTYLIVSKNPKTGLVNPEAAQTLVDAGFKQDTVDNLVKAIESEAPIESDVIPKGAVFTGGQAVDPKDPNAKQLVYYRYEGKNYVKEVPADKLASTVASMEHQPDLIEKASEIASSREAQLAFLIPIAGGVALSSATAARLGFVLGAGWLVASTPQQTRDFPYMTPQQKAITLGTDAFMLVATGLGVRGLKTPEVANIKANIIKQAVREIDTRTTLEKAGDALYKIGYGLGKVAGDERGGAIEITPIQWRTIVSDAIATPKQNLAAAKYYGNIGVQKLYAGLDAIDDGLQRLTQETIEGTTFNKGVNEIRNKITNMKIAIPSGAKYYSGELINKVNNGLDVIDSGLQRLTQEAIEGAAFKKSVTDIRNRISDIKITLPSEVKYYGGEVTQKIYSGLDALDSGLQKLTQEAIEGKTAIATVDYISKKVQELRLSIPAASRYYGSEAMNKMNASFDAIDSGLQRLTQEGIEGTTVLKAIDEIKSNIIKMRLSLPGAVKYYGNEGINRIYAGLDALDDGLQRITQEGIEGTTFNKAVDIVTKEAKQTKMIADYLASNMVLGVKKGVSDGYSSANLKATLNDIEKAIKTKDIELLKKSGQKLVDIGKNIPPEQGGNVLVKKGQLLLDNPEEILLLSDATLPKEDLDAIMAWLKRNYILSEQTKRTTIQDIETYLKAQGKSAKEIAEELDKVTKSEMIYDLETYLKAKNKTPQEIADELEKYIKKTTFEDIETYLKAQDRSEIDKALNKALDDIDKLAKEKMKSGEELTKDDLDKLFKQKEKLPEEKPPEKGGVAVKEKVEVEKEVKPKTAEELEEELFPEKVKPEVKPEEKVKVEPKAPTKTVVPVIPEVGVKSIEGEFISYPSTEGQQDFARRVLEAVPLRLRVPIEEAKPSEELAPKILEAGGLPLTKEKGVGEMEPSKVPSPFEEVLAVGKIESLTSKDIAPKPALEPQPIIKPEIKPITETEIKTVTEVKPSIIPAPSPVPAPEPQPQPQPEPITHRPIPKKVKQPIPIPLPPQSKIDEAQAAGVPKATWEWRMGQKWVVLYPPYRDEDKQFLDQPLPGTYRFSTGKGSAKRTIQVLGGIPTEDADIDMGWAKIHIEAHGAVPTIEFTGGEEAANIRWTQEREQQAIAQSASIVSQEQSIAQGQTLITPEEQLLQPSEYLIPGAPRVVSGDSTRQIVIPPPDTSINRRGKVSNLPELKKTELFQYRVGKLKVYQVDGAYVRDYLDLFPNGEDFTMGGHHFVFDWIPPNEIWIADNINDYVDKKATILHEITEFNLMKEGMPYQEAHDNYANVTEEKGRRNPRLLDELIQTELNKNKIQPIVKSSNSSESMSESNQENIDTEENVDEEPYSYVVAKRTLNRRAEVESNEGMSNLESFRGNKKKQVSQYPELADRYYLGHKLPSSELGVDL